MTRFSIDGILELHSASIAATGGMDGVRDMNLLDSAISSTFQMFGGVALYLTREEQAAHLAFSLINNHPFFDGNKRTGILALLAFLKANQVDLRYTDDDLIALGLGIADGSFEQEDISAWILSHRN